MPDPRIGPTRRTLRGLQANVHPTVHLDSSLALVYAHSYFSQTVQPAQKGGGMAEFSGPSCRKMGNRPGGSRGEGGLRN